MVTIEKLQTSAYEAWFGLHEIHGAHCERQSPWSDEGFLTEARTCGELNSIETWAEFYTRTHANLLVTAHDDDPQFLIEEQLCSAPIREGFSELLPALLQHILEIPKGLDLIAEGLQSIAEYGVTYTSETEVNAMMGALSGQAIWSRHQAEIAAA